MYLGEIPVQFLHPFLAHWVVCLFVVELYIVNGLPQWLSGKESTCNAGDTGDSSLIPGWEDPLEEGMTTYSSISAGRIPMGRGDWRATIHRVAKCRT